jgi:flagellar hook-associated protein 1 FlgK
LNGNLSNLNNIVASKTGSQGDNAIALQIADLRSEKMNFTGEPEGEQLSLDEFYSRLILNFANEGSRADQMLASQTTLVTQADNLRNSIGGVSLDEEMTNMMKFQFAYNASSRTLNVLDEMLETVINRLGITGR